MSLREKKKDKTRLQLLEAALELIGRQGFAETTINQIAAAVDVSPRTLLRYFPSKEDVIVSWVQDGMAIFLSTLASRPADESAAVALLESARALLRSYQERAEFYLTIERVIASAPDISARKQQMSTTLAAAVSAMLAQRTKQIDSSPLANDLYPAVVFALIRIVIQQWVARDGKPPLEELFDEACELIQFQQR
ncbi:MAG TPA: TetR/AcrR family transcriptional regulator [Duganella sp.]|nr:TetR/AcrR family transcriptional regulator [Duganella sp.]